MLLIDVDDWILIKIKIKKRANKDFLATRILGFSNPVFVGLLGSWAHGSPESLASERHDS